MLRGMRNRAGVGHLVLSLAAFLVFMVVLLTVVGAGTGYPELAVWLLALVAGVVLIARRHRNAHRGRS